MKRVTRMMSIVLAAVLVVCFAGVFAQAASETANVWLEAPAKAGSEGVSESIHTDGAATDGMLTVKYDPAVLAVTADDVTAVLAAKWSANATEEGTLLIAWVAPSTAGEGDLFTINFTAKGEGDTGLDLSGDANGADGNALTVGNEITAEPEPTEEPTPTEEPEPTEEPGEPTPTAPAGTQGPAATKAPSETPRTGDESNAGLWLAVTALCGCGLVLCVRKMRGERG